MYKLIKQNSSASSRCQMRAFVLGCQRYIKIANFASLYSGSLVPKKKKKKSQESKNKCKREQDYMKNQLICVVLKNCIPWNESIPNSLKDCKHSNYSPTKLEDDTF